MNEENKNLLEEIKTLAQRNITTTRAGNFEFPVYFGDTESFRTFCQRLNDYANAQNLNEEDMKRLIPLSLRGAAREALESLTTAEKAGTFANLLARLQEKICTPDKQALAQAKLAGLVQDGLTVDLFARKCKELAQEAYPGTEKEGARKAVLLTTFVNGLRQNIRPQVRRTAPATFEEAKRVALQEESILGLESAQGSGELHKIIASLSDTIANITVTPPRPQAPPPRPWSGRSPNFRGRQGNFRGNNSGRQRPFIRPRSQSGPRRGNSWNPNGRREPTGDCNRGQSQQFRGRGSFRQPGGYQYAQNNNRSDFARINALFAQEGGKSRKGQGSKGKGARSVNFLTIACLSLALVTLVSATDDALKGTPLYYCQAPKGGIPMLPPAETECKQPRVKNITLMNVTMFQKNATLTRYEAYKCTVITHTYCTSSAFFFSNFGETWDNGTKPTAEECRKAFQDKQFRGNSLKNTAETTWVSELKPDWPGRTFWDDNCNKVPVIHLQTGTFTLLADNVIFTSLITNADVCKIQDRNCSSPQAIMVWEQSEPRNDVCDFMEVNTYLGAMGDSNLVIREIDSSFPIDPDPVPRATANCFENKVIRALSGPYFRINNASEPIQVHTLARGRSKTPTGKGNSTKNRAKRDTPRSVWKTPHDRQGVGIIKFEGVTVPRPTNSEIVQTFNEWRQSDEHKEGKHLVNSTYAKTVGELIFLFDLEEDDVTQRLVDYSYLDFENALEHALIQNELATSLMEALLTLDNEQRAQTIAKTYHDRGMYLTAELLKPESSLQALAFLCMNLTGPYAKPPWETLDPIIQTLSPITVPPRRNQPPDNTVFEEMKKQVTYAYWNTRAAYQTYRNQEFKDIEELANPIRTMTSLFRSAPAFYRELQSHREEVTQASPNAATVFIPTNPPSTPATTTTPTTTTTTTTTTTPPTTQTTPKPTTTTPKVTATTSKTTTTTPKPTTMTPKPTTTPRPTTANTPTTTTKSTTPNPPTTPSREKTTQPTTTRGTTTPRVTTTTRPKPTVITTLTSTLTSTPEPTTTPQPTVEIVEDEMAKEADVLQKIIGQLPPPPGIGEKREQELETGDQEEEEGDEMAELVEALVTGEQNATVSEEEIASEDPPVPPSTIGTLDWMEYEKAFYDSQQNQIRRLATEMENHKRQYIYDELMDELDFQYSKVFHQACVHRNEQIRIWWALAQMDPTVGMRTLLGRQDITARFIGKTVLLVNNCDEVKIKKIYLNHKVNETCYHRTPVLTERDNLMFLIPGTWDVVTQSMPVNCATISSYVFQDTDGIWKTHGGTANVSIIPGQGDSKGTPVTRLIFTSGDYYGNIKGSQFPGLTLLQLGSEYIRLTAQARALSKFTALKHLPEVNFDDVKIAVGFAWDTTKEAVERTYTRIWDDIMSRGYVLIAVAIAILIIAGTVVAIKWYCMHKVPILAVQTELEVLSPPAETEEEAKKELAEREKQAYSYGGVRYAPLFTYLPIIIPALICAVDAEPCQKHTQIPFVPVTLEDRTIPALWDSGASVSYIPRITAKYLNLKVNPRCGISAKTANGVSFQFVGSVKLTVRIGQETISHTFLVSEDKSCPSLALLGIDFMEALDKKGIITVLRKSKEILQIGETSIPILAQNSLTYKTLEKKVKVQVKQKERFFPRQEKKVIIACVGEIGENEAVILQPLENSPLIFPKTLFHPLNSFETILTITNTTSQTVDLPTGMLGFASIAALPGIAGPSRENQTDHLEERAEQQEIAGPQREYIPPEADWEEQLPEIPKSDFINDLDLTKADLTKSQKKRLTEIIRQNKESFFNEDGRIGYFKGEIQHTIDIRTDLPFPRPRTYRIPLNKQDEVERQVKEMLQQDIIEPSTSLFTSPIVLVKKKDKSFRFTTDFRQLNSVTKREIYLIPNISDIIDLAVGAKFFSNLDLIQGFFQINLRKQDRPLTAFSTPSGTYQYKRMPMGLAGAPHTFQKAVRKLQNLCKARVFCYLDDILIISDSPKHHLRDIEEVLGKISELGLKAKLKKCHFAQREVTFLGYLIGRDGVRPNPEKVKTINDFPRPECQRSVRAFLGISNYFRRFIRNYAEKATPLYLLTKKDTPFTWGEEQEKAFSQLKQALTTAPVLQGPKANRPYTIESDASTIAVGAVLLQAETDTAPLHPIAYASRKLTPTERRYAPIEIEALALLFALTQFRTYVLGAHITAITDHRPLTALLRRQDLIGRLAKYQLALQEYDITIIYRPGKLNSVCDALSRCIGGEWNFPKAKDATPEETEGKICSTQTEKNPETPPGMVKRWQEGCKWIQGTIKTLEKEDRESEDYLKLENRYATHNGMLYQKPQSPLLPLVAILPKDIHITLPLISKFHTTSHLGAHLGAAKTTEAIKRRFQWTGMHQEVKDFVKGCEKCARRKTNPHQTTYEPLESLPNCSMPFERVHIDILGPLPGTEQDNRYILTMRDAFTKWLLAEPLQVQTAEKVAQSILKNLILKLGTPKSITTDNGSQFTSETFQNLTKAFGIEHTLTAPYHKNSNGAIERTHRVIEEALSGFVNSTQCDWDRHLPFVTFAINTVPHEVTKVSPFFALFGREPRLPEDKNWEIQFPILGTDLEDFSTLLKIQLREVHRQIAGKIAEGDQKNQIIQKQQKRVSFREISPGDQILVKRAAPKNKLAPYLQGPFTVREVAKPNVTYMDEKKEKRAHLDDCRLFKAGQQQNPPQTKTENTGKETVDPEERETPIPPPRRSGRARNPPTRFQATN